MKVVLYAAVTANGYIATEDDEVPHVSKIIWKSFYRNIKKHGNIIVGRRTFETNHGTFPYPCFNVVMTKRNIENKWGKNVVFTTKSRSSGFVYRKLSDQSLSGGDELYNKF